MIWKLCTFTGKNTDRKVVRGLSRAIDEQQAAFAMEAIDEQLASQAVAREAARR